MLILLTVWLLAATIQLLFPHLVRTLCKPVIDARAVDATDYSIDACFRRGILIWCEGLRRPCRVRGIPALRPGQRIIVGTYRVGPFELLNDVLR